MSKMENSDKIDSSACSSSGPQLCPASSDTSEFEKSACWSQILEVYQDSIIESSSEDEVSIRMGLKNEEEAETFLNIYSNITKTNWIVVKGIPSPRRILYSKRWYCQHSKRNKKEDSKRNAKCNATLKIVIKKLNRNTIRNDKFLKLIPPLLATVKISLKHSHPTMAAESLRMLRVKDGIKEQFFDYFNIGMTPAEAITFHENQFIVAEDVVQHADASINPTLNQVQNIYYSWRELNLGTYWNPLEKLKEKQKLYENQGTDLRIVEDESWAVVLVTPIMKRVQQLQEANEMIFVDSTCSCESTSTTLTVVLVATKVGALPVAVLIHPAQTTESYSKAFKLLKDNFPTCFGGKSDPQIFMTDDSRAEKNALKNVWPQSHQLLCHFHVAQAEWRWIFSQSSKIPKEERPRLMRLFQSVMYANSEEILSASVKALVNEEHLYPDFVQRFLKFFERRAEWVLLDRLTLLTRGNNTNNFAEASIRILKDIVLCRTKAFNIVALSEFIITTWEAYFKKKLLDYAHSRKRSIRYKFLQKVYTLKEEEIEDVGSDVYRVKSSSDPEKWYTIHADIGVCDCFSGSTGALCKHQYLLFEKKKIHLPNAPPCCPEEKHALAALALGPNCPPKEFFQGFKPQAQEKTLIEEEQPIEEALPIEEAQPIGEALSIGEEMELISNQDRDIINAELSRIALIVNNSTITKNEALKLIATLKEIKSDRDLTNLRILKVGSFKRKRINVQPTSISRRRPGVVRSSRRIPAGRPPVSLNKQDKKRRRNLSSNISNNKPNAKSHGLNH